MPAVHARWGPRANRVDTCFGQNRELEILIELREIRKHGNVIELKTHYEDLDADGRYLYLVMDYMPHDLEQLISRYASRKKLVPVAWTTLYLYALD